MTMELWPSCQHGSPCVLKTGTRPGPRLGRNFYICCKRPNEQCDFVQPVKVPPMTCPEHGEMVDVRVLADHMKHTEQLQQQLKEAETEKHLLLQQHREQCESLKQSLGEKEQGCSSLQQQLAATNTARESAETSLKNERAISQKLHQERDDLQTTCEAFKGEVNSLLADLQEQTSTIKTLEEERDALRNQGDGLRRKFAENQERMRKLEEDVGRGQEREKRLQDQRDGLQNREELMDLQLKQYISDFNEERAAREKMSEVVRLLEAREKDSNAQIALLRKQVTDLSTEKNDLSAQNEHLRLQLQQFQQ